MKKVRSTESTSEVCSDPVQQITESSNFGYIYWEYTLPPLSLGVPRPKPMKSRERTRILSFKRATTVCASAATICRSPPTTGTEAICYLYIDSEVETFTVQEFSINVYVGGIAYRCEGESWAN